MNSNFVVGLPKMEQISLMTTLLQSYNFSPGPLATKGGKEIPLDKVNSCLKKFKKKNSTF